jgi:hypothetical protein
MYPNFHYFDQNCQVQILNLNQEVTPSEMTMKLTTGRVVHLLIKNNPWIANGDKIIFKHCTVCGDQRDVNLVRPGGSHSPIVCSKIECCRKIVLAMLLMDQHISFVSVVHAHNLPNLEFHNADV